MKQSKIIPYLATGAALLTPLAVFAQDDTVFGVLSVVKGILSALIPILFGLAFVYFAWGLIKYVGSASDEEKKKEARGQMIYGIIIIAVMLGVWGLAGILLNTFVPNWDVIPPIPNIFN